MNNETQIVQESLSTLQLIIQQLGGLFNAHKELIFFLEKELDQLYEKTNQCDKCKQALPPLSTEDRIKV